MHSPIKKPNFSVADKENIEVAVPIVGIPDLDELDTSAPKQPASVAATIKPEEVVEPLLQENPQRFVLFPIKYPEVRVHQTLSLTRLPYASNLLN